MPSCVVKRCTSRGRKPEENVILHVFPKNLYTIRLWLQLTGQYAENLEEFAQTIFEGKPNDSYRMCSKHFTESCYRSGGPRRKLKDDAYPTLFEKFEEIEPPPRKRRERFLPSLGYDMVEFQNPNAVTVGTNTYLPFRKDQATVTNSKYISKVRAVQAKPDTRDKSVQCNLQSDLVITFRNKDKWLPPVN